MIQWNGDVPELTGVPLERRRRLWNEAVTRSAAPRWIALQLALQFCVALTVTGLGYLCWPDGIRPALPFMIGIAIGLLVAEPIVRPKRARAWLREHATGLDRYAPP